MKRIRTQQPTLLLIALAALLTLAGCNNAEQSNENSGLAAKNLEKSKTFMAANATKEGVITLPSGVQYKVISENVEGKLPKLTDSVHMHLRMSLTDGTVVVDTNPSGNPTEVYIKTAINGWKKTLTKMSVGSKWIVYIPPHMAYSSRGNENVGPNEALICEIELLDIIW